MRHQENTAREMRHLKNNTAREIRHLKRKQSEKLDTCRRIQPSKWDRVRTTQPENDRLQQAVQQTDRDHSYSSKFNNMHTADRAANVWWRLLMRSGRRLVSSGYTSCHKLTDFSYDSMIRLCTVGDLSPNCPRQLLYWNHVSGKHTGYIWRKEISGEKKSMEKRVGCFLFIYLFVCCFFTAKPLSASQVFLYLLQCSYMFP